VEAIEGSGGTLAPAQVAWLRAQLAAAGRRYVLVTSDRELRGRAGQNAAEVIGGGKFARTLQSLAESPSA
jgi:hypothetical protein